MPKKNFRLNVGQLSSLRSLFFSIGPQLGSIRKLIQENREEDIGDIRWDFTSLISKKISTSALTAFLSAAYGLSQYLKKPIPIKIEWDPEILGFLHDMRFIEISSSLGILEWDEKLIGGFEIYNNTLINNSIYHFKPTQDDETFISNYWSGKTNVVELKKWKEKKREAISWEIYKSTDTLLQGSTDFDRWNDNTQKLLTRCIPELVVNCFLHARCNSFIGIQRTSKRVTVTVNDNGPGFASTLKHSTPWVEKMDVITETEATIIASTLNPEINSLCQVIDTILDHPGESWINIHCNHSEVKWTKRNWSELRKKIDYKSLGNVKPPFMEWMGDPLTTYATRQDHIDGFYSKHDHYLKGVRIAFEVDK